MRLRVLSCEPRALSFRASQLIARDEVDGIVEINGRLANLRANKQYRVLEF